MRNNKFLAILALLLTGSNSTPALATLICEADKYLELNQDQYLLKTQIDLTGKTKEIRVVSVSVATANAYSEDSWDLWTMAKTEVLNREVALTWAGHPFVSFLGTAKNPDQNSKIRSVSVQANPSAPQPNGFISINDQEPLSAYCR